MSNMGNHFNFLLSLFVFYISTKLSCAEGSKHADIRTRAVAAPPAENRSVHDHYPGSQFIPPPYYQGFLDHLDAIEVEYLEFFSQLAPIGEPPVIISPCLQNGTTLERRFKISIGQFKKAVRKLKGLLNREINRILGTGPPKPVFTKWCTMTSLRIPVYYHVVSSNFERFANVKPEVIDSQHEYLNQIFEHMSIQFVKKDVNYRINPLFANHEMSFTHPHRRQTRSGKYWDLNVWIVEDTWYTDNGTVHGLEGYASFPNATMNNYERSFDGVVVAGQYIHEREVTNRTTLHHEIGHWLGLRHVFAANQGDSLTCLSKPDNDELPDTQQFPYHQETMFDRYQKPCESEEEVLVTNIMSYSTAGGADGVGFKTGQKVRAFRDYMGIRRGLNNLQDCVLAPIAGQKRALPENVVDLLKEDDLSCLADLERPIEDLSLRPPPDENWPQYPVLVGPRNAEPAENPNDTPAGSSKCPNGGINQCNNNEGKNPGGNQGTNPGGNQGTDPGNNQGTNPDPGNTTPNTPQPPTTCPKACNVHSNTCHRPTAQTCIYPEPLIPNPRAACACRPGYRAAASANDTSSHWRLPIPGLEDFVWVAEGVECNTRCDGAPGTPDCREVTVLREQCLAL